VIRSQFPFANRQSGSRRRSRHRFRYLRSCN
jgi:hypothetical protein